MNQWEISALHYKFPEQETQADEASCAVIPRQTPRDVSTHNSIIYPGLYSTSGFDMMSILIRVATRPNPKVNLGPIDFNVALLLCDLQQPDTPIVYASETFCDLTGYSQAEVIGRNCRFLQAPGGAVQPHQPRRFVNQDTIDCMRTAVQKNSEVQLEVVNFKKDGTAFVNLLTIVPITWDSNEYRYSVGFQADRDA